MWLPPPPDGTPVCLGFDGSDTDDWTVVRAETMEGYAFTPRYAGSEPTIWQPKSWGGKVPRSEVRRALDEVFDRFQVVRMYCDPPRWETDVETWATAFGDDVVLEWPTYRPRPMHASLERFRTDLTEGRITHDGCPLTAQAMANARMVARSGDLYILSKPSQTQKIDPVMGAVLAHEAACDARASGWSADSGIDSSVYVF